MDFGLKNKVAIVTGTASPVGFGYAIAMTLAKEGCHVASLDINGEGAEKTAAEIKKLGVKSVSAKVDISNRASVDEALAKVNKELGQVDILVNNAGASVPWNSSLEYSHADLQKMIDINYFGQINMCQAVAPQMVARKAGKIVNFSGGQGFPRDGAYGGSKGAIDSWTVSLAKELIGQGVYVNLFLPPAADTNLGAKHLPPGFWEPIKKMNPLKRMCQPQEVANMIAYMVSDCNSFMAGQLIKIDVM